MSNTITALGRQKTFRSGTWLPYRGHHQKYSLKVGNLALLHKFEEEADLWYLEFEYQNQWFLSAGCVFDIDLSGPIQHHVYMATLAKNSAALLRLLNPIVELVKKELAELPFRIFASGSKGIHVYVKNPNGFLVASSSAAFTSIVLTRKPKSSHLLFLLPRIGILVEKPKERMIRGYIGRL